MTGSAAAAFLGRPAGIGPLAPGNPIRRPMPIARAPGWLAAELGDAFDQLDRQCTGNLAAFIAEPICRAAG